MKLLAPLVRSNPSQNFDQFGLNPWANFATFSVGGNTYSVPIATTMPGQKTEALATSFEGFVRGGLYSSGPVASCEAKRLEVFAQGRFQFQKINKGRPGDLFGDQSLSILENPWPGGTTGDLLALMLLYADFGGQAYVTILDGEMIVMRPDWVQVVLGDRRSGVGLKKVGYRYFEGGPNSGATPISFPANRVAHFAPKPDPLSRYLGMAWLTPVVREIQADAAATGHKLAFFDNAATPNLAVSLKEITDPQQFTDFIDAMDDSHQGWQNAYKTLYLGAGADVTVIGKDFQQLDFKATQGAGETRIAAAAGVHPVVAGLSEGLAGSSLNAGNFGQARRQFTDTTCAHLWQNVAASLEQIVPVPGGQVARLWVDTRDIPFMREDQKDAAEIMQLNAQAVRELFMAGFTPESATAAVNAQDLSLLEHTGLFSIQLQEPGSVKMPGQTVDEGNALNPAVPGAIDKTIKPAAAPPPPRN